MLRILANITLTGSYGIPLGAIVTFFRTLQYSTYQEQNDSVRKNLLQDIAVGVGFATSLSCAYHAYKWCKKAISTKRVAPAYTRRLDNIVPSATVGAATVDGNLPTIEEGIEEEGFPSQKSAEPFMQR